MANPTGFIEFPRVEVEHRPVEERIGDWLEIDRPLVEAVLNRQAARCMDCGTPFCHAAGCPLKNRIPEFNDLVHRGRWREAAENLHWTNNFPEITGRVCPAPCEAACTLAINSQPVTIKHIEYQIAERAFAEGWVRPLRPQVQSGKRVAVVGSGPAGLAVAQQLTRAGHEVVVFEKDDRIGGLLRYGIPDFKLEKRIIDRRLEQMSAEGTKFEPGVCVGTDVSGRYLRQMFHAICLTMGAGQPRPLRIPGADLDGVHYAMDFLSQQNRRVAGGGERGTGDGGRAAGCEEGFRVQGSVAEDSVHHSSFIIPPSSPTPHPPSPAPLSASGKHVIVVGGGDTGSDCVGTSIRQGALSVTQLEILPKPPEGRNPETPWPFWPKIMRSSSSHEEGCGRRWSVLTKAITEGMRDEGRGASDENLAPSPSSLVPHPSSLLLHCIEVQWTRGPKGWEMKELPGTEFTLPADLVLLAMGFLHVVHPGLVEQLGIALDGRGNVQVKDWMTSQPGIFAAGDTSRGASLVVHAINEGRQAAAAIDRWLKTAQP